jgi:hypothetical protein
MHVRHQLRKSQSPYLVLIICIVCGPPFDLDLHAACCCCLLVLLLLYLAVTHPQLRALRSAVTMLQYSTLV